MKRLLSLNLVLIVLLGILPITVITAYAAENEIQESEDEVISSSANTDTDNIQIEYTGASAIVNALGLYQDGICGAFKPEEILTRAEASVLITRIMLGEISSKLVATRQTFSDVPTSYWAAKHIEYCTNIGIISGVGDGTFNPGGEMTALAFGRLLLNALGYDNQNEGYVGINWATNIAVDMISAGLNLENIALFDGLTNAQAAQMILQALDAKMVCYQEVSDEETGETTIVGSEETGETFAEVYFPSVVKGTCGENLTWVLTSDGVLTISGEGAMVFPSTGVPWSSQRKSIKTVVIAPGVTTIGTSAFSNCYVLSSVTIPDGVITIGSGSFYACSRLSTVNLPESLIEIGTLAFKYCSGLSSVNIPKNVSTIKALTFYGCTRLTSIIIPDSVTSIESYAFENCSGLSAITIPQSVISIGTSSFSGCTGLKTAGPFGGNYSIQFGWTDAIPSKAFYSCEGLTSVTIPDGVTSIGNSAFYGCTNLLSITMPDSVTSIGGCAFADCTKLTSIVIPRGVTTIGKATFRGCRSLTSVTIPNSVVQMGSDTYDGAVFSGCPGLKTAGPIGGNYNVQLGWTDTIPSLAFLNCTGLTSVIIPDSVTTIDEAAFGRCTSLTSVTIPDSVTSIGDSAFFGCTGLTSVVIPDSVTSIGVSAFSSCVGLTSVVIPDSVTAIEGDTFSRCTGLTSIVIPDSVTAIEGDTFWGCTSLTSVTIPDSVTSIGDSAFFGCTGLTSVVIPNSVSTIGWSAFVNCTSLTSVVIPASVTSIGSQAFYSCRGLKEVKFLGDAPANLDCSSFDDVTATAYYPEWNDTWTQDVMQNYGGSITWVPFDNAAILCDICNESDTSIIVLYDSEVAETVTGYLALYDKEGRFLRLETVTEQSTPDGTLTLSISYTKEEYTEIGRIAAFVVNGQTMQPLCEGWDTSIV